MILVAVEAPKDVSLVELADLLRIAHGAPFAASTVWRFLDRRTMTYKKSAHAAEQERADVAARRRAWFAAQPELDPERLVLIDETGALIKMARLRGRAWRGQRCRASVPHGHWTTTTFTGALRVSGMTAPMVLDGPMNRVAFQAYIQQVLVPTLRRGDTVSPAPRCRPTGSQTDQARREQGYAPDGLHGQPERNPAPMEEEARYPAWAHQAA